MWNFIVISPLFLHKWRLFTFLLNWSVWAKSTIILITFPKVYLRYITCSNLPVCFSVLIKFHYPHSRELARNFSRVFKALSLDYFSFWQFFAYINFYFLHNEVFIIHSYESIIFLPVWLGVFLVLQSRPVVDWNCLFVNAAYAYLAYLVNIGMRLRAPS